MTEDEARLLKNFAIELIGAVRENAEREIGPRTAHQYERSNKIIKQRFTSLLYDKLRDDPELYEEINREFELELKAQDILLNASARANRRREWEQAFGNYEGTSVLPALPDAPPGRQGEGHVEYWTRRGAPEELEQAAHHYDQDAPYLDDPDEMGVWVQRRGEREFRWVPTGRSPAQGDPSFSVEYSEVSPESPQNESDYTRIGVHLGREQEESEPAPASSYIEALQQFWASTLMGSSASAIFTKTLRDRVNEWKRYRS